MDNAEWVGLLVPATCLVFLAFVDVNAQAWGPLSAGRATPPPA
jgi:hypothetical protein